ncbi:adenosylcobinamide-phosphate synthase CbiB [Marininema mesophilum]|nr:adenosylcobinamide-phosphate synthase CbiB [Marininema mesophilum]
MEWLLILALLLDFLIGDPRWLPHPVIAMGKSITAVESWLRRLANIFHITGALGWRILGCFLPILIVGGTYLLGLVIVMIAYYYSPWVGGGVEVLLIATTIAPRGLAEAGSGIYHALAAQNLVEARRRLALVVGRDTEHLDEIEIVRGAVETVAENIVDGVTSPLFYAALGGAPLALAYRAVNTLDSMVGYKNERYRYLGWASARLDDLANWIPARLTLPVILCALAFMRKSPVQAWRMIRRDAALHPSPNSGIAEAVVAGGLGIQLGGTNRYDGVISERARLGDDLRVKRKEDIITTIQLLWWVTVLYTGGLVVVGYLVNELIR